MDTWKLEAFVKTIDLGSISRAAVALHLAQSALSQHLSSLETKLSVKLLVRTKQGVEPTAAGRVLYRHAQLILRGVDNAVQEVKAVSEGPSGRVSVGLAPYSFAAALAVPLIEAVRAAAPKIVLHVRENFGGILSEAIATGQMDLGVLYTPVPLRAVHVEPIHRERLWLATSKRAGLPDVVSFPTLTDTGVFLPSRQHSIRLAVDAAFQQHNLFPRLLGEVESVPTLMELISRDLGATILPFSAFPSLGSYPEVQIHELDDPVTDLGIALCTGSHQPLSDQARIVESILRDLLMRSVNSSADHAASAQRD
ncbi:LysR substrate-binding domain-containing protein [Arthrobacter sp. D1-29]